LSGPIGNAGQLSFARMTNEYVKDLYDRVSVGATVIVKNLGARSQQYLIVVVRSCSMNCCGFNFRTATLFKDTASRSRRMFRASFCRNVPPSHNRGRRECRAPDAPAAARVV